MKYCVIIFFLLFTLNSIAQIEGMSNIDIKENKILSSRAKLDVASDNPIYEGLVVREFIFDEQGNSISKKFLFPFYDVVATSDEYYFFYEKGNKTKELKIHKTVGVSDQGKEFIALFGETNDTTTTIYTYNVLNLLDREVVLKSGSKDSLIVSYIYEDSTLIESVHYNTKTKGELDNENFIRTYKYDDLGRMINIEEQPFHFDKYSTEFIEYYDASELVKSRTKLNGFRWLREISNGKMSLNVSQDSLFGYKKVFEYDKNNNKIKEVEYRDLNDFTKGAVATCAPLIHQIIHKNIPSFR